MSNTKKAEIKLDFSDMAMALLAVAGLLTYAAFRGGHNFLRNYYASAIRAVPGKGDLRHLAFQAHMQSAADALRNKQTMMLADYLQNKLESGDRRVPAALRGGTLNESLPGISGWNSTQNGPQI